MKRPIIVLIVLVILLGAASCGPAAVDDDWSFPAAPSGDNGDAAIQQVLDEYGAAVAAHDRTRLAGVLDPASTEFSAQQLALLDRMQDVPFAQYSLKLDSQTQDQPGVVTAKVAISYTFQDSFGELREPYRVAFRFVQRDGAWKLSADATREAIGKAPDVQLWDLAPVRMLAGEHSLVLYHPGWEATAGQAHDEADAAWPRLQQALPGTELPKVPIIIYDDKSQIDAAFPGKWQEWTGGASRQLGGSSGQGGEVIIEGDLFQRTGASGDYNPKMIAHEFTHVALFPLVGAQTPPFLVEGLADYAAGADTAMLLRDQLKSGMNLRPALRDLCQPASFTVLLDTQAAALAYEEADTAVAFLEKRYGNERVLDLMKEFDKNSGDASQDQLVDDAFRKVTGVDWNGFEQQWRDFVLAGCDGTCR